MQPVCGDYFDDFFLTWSLIVPPFSTQAATERAATVYSITGGPSHHGRQPSPVRGGTASALPASTNQDHQ